MLLRTMPSAPDLGVRRATATILTGTQGHGDVWVALPIAAPAIAVTHRTRTIPLARKNSIPEPNLLAAIAGVFATGMTVRVVLSMVPALANPIATQTSARPAMAMAPARSVAATRIRPAVTAHAMTRKPSSVVMISRLTIHVISTALAVMATAAAQINGAVTLIKHVMMSV
jgi:hypothetical protein